MTDEELRDELLAIDINEDVTVETYEADFIENVVFRYHGPLSDKQREKAAEIIEKYLA